jgi:NADPH-dependent 2,4-dienoyl-CoA reductase/sulfur reductase-like enzyme
MSAPVQNGSIFDIVVIGAGPAGIAAATTAAKAGCSVCLLDEQSDAGGQIYRGLPAIDSAQQSEPSAAPAANEPDWLGHILGSDYTAGRALLGQLPHTGIHSIPAATVWQVGEDGSVTYSQRQQATRIAGRHIIVATGAMERPLPVPGWTLPGVLTVGAAQIALKTSGLLPVNAILAGSGPLLYYFACQLLRANCPPRAIVDTSPGLTTSMAGRLLSAVLPHRRQLMQGVTMLRQLKSSGIPCYKRAYDLNIIGDARARSIRFRHRGSTPVTLDCDMVLLHDGIVPNTQISRSLRLQHTWDQTHRYFVPVTDDYGVSSVDRISIAGDGSGIMGAEASAQHGALVSMQAIDTIDKHAAHYRNSNRESNRGPDQSEQNNLKKHIASARQFQRLLATLYPPYYAQTNVADSTIVCRCEQVVAADIRRCVKAGCTGPNQTKSYTRCGMGPCQGRMCGLTITDIIAKETALPEDTVGSFRIRSPIKPVTLAELASLAGDATNGSPATSRHEAQAVTAAASPVHDNVSHADNVKVQ